MLELEQRIEALLEIHSQQRREIIRLRRQVRKIRQYADALFIALCDVLTMFA